MSVDSTDSIKEYTPENRHQNKQKKNWAKSDWPKILRKKVRGQKSYTGTCEFGGGICCCLWY